MSDTNEFGTPYDQTTFPMSATTNRENKFAPCPHDPAGARKDECVKCYPPERYLGLSGNLLITEKKPEMTAATLEAEWLAEWLTQDKHLAWPNWLSQALLEAREAIAHLQAELRDAKQLLIAEIDKTSRLERELVAAKQDIERFRDAGCEWVAERTRLDMRLVAAQARIMELEGSK